MLNAVWNKLYRRDLIDFTFNPKVNMGEDLLFNIEYLKRSVAVYVINVCLYNYIIRNNSAVRTFQNDRVHTVISLCNTVNEYFCLTYNISVCYPVYKFNINEITSAFINLLCSDYIFKEKYELFKHICADKDLYDFIEFSRLNSKLPYCFILNGRLRVAFAFYYFSSLPYRFKLLVLSILK